MTEQISAYTSKVASSPQFQENVRQMQQAIDAFNSAAKSAAPKIRQAAIEMHDALNSWATRMALQRLRSETPKD